VGAAVVVGYAFRADLGDTVLRVRSALIPSYAIAAGDHTLVLGQDSDGGYHVVGQVNGQRVGFLVDTGSSDIVLSPADAQRIGVDLAALRYTHVYETANGEGQGAAYIAPSMAVGPLRMTNVAVSINKAPMSSSLLGMAFLKRMDSFEFKSGQLILRRRG
jgi:aspartyl protease family protein